MDPKQRRIVEIFDDELQSLLDTKPPVSKTKMVSITRAAIKGVKSYKHIVQIVEKFIFKCRSEYKVPGLYVIDSIVRQSRHQFGIERDVYAARFSRNIQITFNNLFAGCSPDDKPKIVRVLNLWQKNGVFNAKLIQPLLDMANPNSALALPTESTLSADSPNLSIGPEHHHLSARQAGQTSKYSSGNQYSSNNNNHQCNKNNKGRSSNGAGALVFDKKLLDFEYDEDDDDNDNFDGGDGPTHSDDGDETPTEAEPPLSSTLNKIEMEQRNRNEPNHVSMNYAPSQQLSSRGQQQQSINYSNNNHQHHQHQQEFNEKQQDPVLERWNRLLRQQSIQQPSENHADNHQSSEPFRQIPNQRDRNRSRSRSRSPPNRHNESSRHQANSSHSLGERSIEADRVSPKPKSPDRKEERAAERLRKCLPPIRDKHLTVCSSPLWLGHVPKTVSEADISDAFGEYGSITSIDLIPPRGCAYVCMDRRQDAKRALNESRDLKLNGSHIKMAWAPGKGFKEYRKLKDFWEVDIGSSYIPYNKIDASIDFDKLEEGGVIDEDSMSMEMREMRERKNREKEQQSNKDSNNITINSNNNSVNIANTILPQQPTGIALPIPALPILSQPPPTFNLAQPPPTLTIPPPSHIDVSQHPSHLTILPPQTNHLNLQQAGLAPLQPETMLPQPAMPMLPINLLNQGQMPMPQQPGTVPFWDWGMHKQN